MLPCRQGESRNAASHGGLSVRYFYVFNARPLIQMMYSRVGESTKLGCMQPVLYRSAMLAALHKLLGSGSAGTAEGKSASWAGVSWLLVSWLLCVKSLPICTHACH